MVVENAANVGVTGRCLRNGALERELRSRGGRLRGLYSGYVLSDEKHALACMYLWESLELDNAELTFRAKLPPEEAAGER